jgi:hypothetical protein
MENLELEPDDGSITWLTKKYIQEGIIPAGVVSDEDFDIFKKIDREGMPGGHVAFLDHCLLL